LGLAFGRGHEVNVHNWDRARLGNISIHNI
jgi:hypothetical protein